MRPKRKDAEGKMSNETSNGTNAAEALEVLRQREAEEKQRGMRDELQAMIETSALTPVAAADPTPTVTFGIPPMTLPEMAEAKNETGQETNATKEKKPAKGKTSTQKTTVSDGGTARPRRGSENIPVPGDILSPNTMLNTAEKGRAKGKTAAKAAQSKGTSSSSVGAQIAEAKQNFTAAQTKVATSLDDNDLEDYNDSEDEEKGGEEEQSGA